MAHSSRQALLLGYERREVLTKGPAYSQISKMESELWLLTRNQASVPYQTLARFKCIHLIAYGSPVNAVRPTSGS